MLILLVLLLLLVPVPVGATTYYVSLGGHGETSVTNANTCSGSPSTVGSAQNILYPKRWQTADGNGPGGLSCLTAAGDVLLIRGGTYLKGDITTVPPGL